MTILIPTTSSNQEKCCLASLENNASWAFIHLEEGHISSCEFFEDKEQINEWIDAVVVLNDKEYVWPFMEEGIVVLTAPHQRTIDEIVEAFLFKELHDLSV